MIVCTKYNLLLFTLYRKPEKSGHFKTGGLLVQRFTTKYVLWGGLKGWSLNTGSLKLYGQVRPYMYTVYKPGLLNYY